MEANTELMEAQGAATAASALALPAQRYGHRRLRGSFDLKLDKTGRIAIPGAFRHAFTPGPDQCVVSPLGPHHLGLWTLFSFDVFLDDVINDDQWNAVNPREVRVMEALARDVSIDTQYRIVIPPETRAEVDLGSQIMLVGTADRVEIWNDEAWAIEKAAAKAKVTEAQNQARVMRR